MTSSLELPALPARKGPSRATRIILIAVAALLPLTWFIWFLATPPGLAVSPREASGSTVVGTPLYVGMYTPAADFDRTISLTGVKVDVTANAEVDVAPLLCRGGSIGLSTKPDQFCTELIDPEGEEFGVGDSIVVEVSADQPAVAVVDRVRLGFRQDVRSATLEAGIARATVTIGTQPTR